MPHLRPCSVCSRHVRADETRCPFCQTVLEGGPSIAALPAGRVGRAARMAFGAAVAATASLPACAAGTSPGDAGTVSHVDGGDSGVVLQPPFDGGSVAKPYGAPPADGVMGARRVV